MELLAPSILSLVDLDQEVVAGLAVVVEALLLLHRVAVHDILLSIRAHELCRQARSCMHPIFT